MTWLHTECRKGLQGKRIPDHTAELNCHQQWCKVRQLPEALQAISYYMRAMSAHLAQLTGLSRSI